MNATEIATLSMSELKFMCASHAISVTGDRRLKATYVNAVESFQSLQTVIDIETLPATPDPFEDSYEFVINPETAFQSEVPDVLSIIDKSDNMITLQQLTNETPIAQQLPMPQPTHQPPTPQRTTPTTQHRGASVVMLTPLVLLTVAVISLKIGISTIIPIIGSVWRLSGSIWQSFTHTDRGTESLDFSTAAA